jgi:hypothetical protein
MQHETARTHYLIRIRGQIGGTLLSAFAGLHAEVRHGETMLSGELPDQAALFGVLAQVEALGLELLEVRRPPAPAATPPGTHETNPSQHGKGSHRGSPVPLDD